MALEERMRKPSDSSQHLVCYPQYFLSSLVLFPKGSPRSGRSRVLSAGWTAFHLMSDWRAGSEVSGLQLTAHSCEFCKCASNPPHHEEASEGEGCCSGTDTEILHQRFQGCGVFSDWLFTHQFFLPSGLWVLLISFWAASLPHSSPLRLWSSFSIFLKQVHKLFVFNDMYC